MSFRVWQVVAAASVFLYCLVVFRISSDSSSSALWTKDEEDFSQEWGSEPITEDIPFKRSKAKEAEIEMDEDVWKPQKPKDKPKPKRLVGLGDLAAKIKSFTNDEDDDNDEDAVKSRRPREVEAPRTSILTKEVEGNEEEDDASPDEKTGEEEVETQLQSPTYKTELSDDIDAKPDIGQGKSEAADDSTSETKPTRWERYFDSDRCRNFRQLPPGHSNTRDIGQGQRSLCSSNLAERQTIEYRTEIGGSIDISFAHKTIYIPVMKAGSQMFQEVFRQRLKGRRIYDRELAYYLRKYDLSLNDFFIFTFVRNPFSTFVSAYGEVSKYSARNRTLVKGFADIADMPENEPKRALACLEDIKRGTFHGLIPAHMHTQLWKISRCMADKAHTEIPIHFVGHLDNLEADWKYVEARLTLPHQDLPVIHSSSSAPGNPKRKLLFDPPSKGSAFSQLTKEVCDYYKADFACFGYDEKLCSS